MKQPLFVITPSGGDSRETTIYTLRTHAAMRLDRPCVHPVSTRHRRVGQVLGAALDRNSNDVGLGPVAKRGLDLGGNVQGV